MKCSATFSRLQILVLIMLLPGCSAILSSTDTAIKGNMPEIKKDCLTCHTSHGADGELVLKEPITKLCLECHPDRKGPAEHKVDVIISSPVPGLPLTEGKMTCVTCHDPHSNANGAMLRMGREKLCLSCHNQ
ncbi:MAG: cytochrome c3 family protein [Nitrospirae bacterium]|nr:cytochrome c3 family protein [Nitrospirota bacterium]